MYVVYWVYNLVKGQAEDARNKTAPPDEMERSADDPGEEDKE